MQQKLHALRMQTMLGIRMRKSRLTCERGPTSGGRPFGQDMKNVVVSFEYCKAEHLDKGSEYIKCHMIFDIKMDLTRKARLVAKGHVTEAPSKEFTFLSVVPC